MGTTLTIENVRKRYAEVEALAGVSLQIQGGEFFTLLGPSGCGKTTLLRCVAGFLRPDAGRILCDSERLDTSPAHRRDIGMVFQNYAIFPHLSVFESVAYGLRARRIPPEEIRRRADGVRSRVLAVFRPEAVELLFEGAAPPDATVGQGVVVNREFLGAVLRYCLRLSDGPLIHLDEHKPDPGRLCKEGEQVRFSVHPADVMLFPAEA